MRTRDVVGVMLILLEGACTGQRPTRSALATDSGTVRVGSATLRYVVEGAGTPCIVFGSRLYYPRTFSRQFKNQLRCLFLDTRGFTEGAEPEPGQFYGVPAMVADLETARQTLGLDGFVLVGHSIHGLVVLAYARQYPEHVTHVVAIGAPPEYSQHFVESVNSFWDTNASAGRKAQDGRNRARIPADSLRKLSPSDAFVANYVAAAARYWYDSTYDGSRVWAGVHVNASLVGQIFDVARPFSLGQEGTPVSVPAYVALGRSDFAVPYTLWDGYRGPFTNLTIKVFDRAAHTPQLEDSTAFDTEVLPWLRR